MRSGCRGGRVDRKTGFTIVEILVVMAIILVLAGLILATSSYVHNKGARSRAEAEIAAMSAALENYKADNGVYPRDLTANTATDKLNAESTTDPLTTAPVWFYTEHSVATEILIEQLQRDDSNIDGQPDRRLHRIFSLSPISSDRIRRSIGNFHQRPVRQQLRIFNDLSDRSFQRLQSNLRSLEHLTVPRRR